MSSTARLVQALWVAEPHHREVLLSAIAGAALTAMLGESADEEAALAAAGTCRSCLRPDADIDAAGLCANCAGARDRIRAEIRRGSNARHQEMVRLGPGGTA